MKNFSIDPERCIQCGACVRDCPVGVIEMKDYPVLEKPGCFECQHCLTVCPTGALSILGKNPADSTPLKENLPDPEKLAVLIKGRRSYRKYKQENLEQETMQKLLSTALHAPTGVNARSVQFTVIDDKAVLAKFREATYAELAKIIPPEPAPDDHVMQFLSLGIKRWNEGKADLLFRGAPHLIVASAPQEAPCVEADPIIALSYFELQAQAMGIGTVWNGMVKNAISRIPELAGKLGVPANHSIGYVMSFGKPDVKYHRTAQRDAKQIKFVHFDSTGRTA